MKITINPDALKQILPAAQKEAQKMGADFIKKIKCPICGKSAVLKSAEVKRLGFDYCHVELKEAIERALK